jgi:hypothetical protein
MVAFLVLAGCATHGYVAEQGPSAAVATRALLKDALPMDTVLVEGGRYYRIFHGLDDEVAAVLQAVAAADPTDEVLSADVGLNTDMPPVLTPAYPVRVFRLVLLAPGNDQSTLRLVRMEPGRYQVWWSDSGDEWPSSPRERRVYFLSGATALDAAWDALAGAVKAKATSKNKDGTTWRPWLAGG